MSAGGPPAGGAAAGGPPALSKWLVLAITGSGTFMSTLDAGMINVALPTITRHFDAPLVTTQWVVLAYVLCITSLLLPMGRLADMVGRKRVFLGGFVVAGVGSLICGLAPSLAVLIAGRVVQGIGGAMLQPTGQALITQAFPSSERGRALGMNLSIVSAGFVSGPVIGGLIIDLLGWQWLFFVSVPIAVLGALAGLRLLPASAPLPGQRFDPAGAALFMVTIVSLLLALNRGGQEGWTAPTTLALAIVALAAALLFVLAERRAVQPIVEVGLFRIPGFRVAISCAFLMFLGGSTVVLLMPFYLQGVLGLTASQAGLVQMTQSATLLVLAPIAGSLSDRLGVRLLASLGAGVAALGFFSLTTLGASSAAPEVVARLAVLALGMAMFNSPNASALFGALPRERYGVGGAYQNLARNLAQSLGQVTAATLWTAVIVQSSGLLPAAAAPADQMPGFRVVFGLAAGLVAVAAVLSLLARPTEARPAAAPQAEPAGPRSPAPGDD